MQGNSTIQKTVAVFLLLWTLIASGADTPVEPAPPLTTVRYEQTDFARLVDRAIFTYFPMLLAENIADNKNYLSLDAVRMLSLSLGHLWKIAAYHLEFSDQDFEYIKTKALKGIINESSPEILRLVSENKLMYYDDESVIEQIIIFLSLAQERHSVEEIAHAMEDIDGDLPEFLINLNQYDALAKKSSPIRENRQYSSYIFLLWLKHPTRSISDEEGIPNTETFPHQQTVYDWARLNPNKLVVLWYDSHGLTESEISQYKLFRQTMQQALNNIEVLDISDVSWGERYLDFRKQGLGKYTPRQALDHFPFPDLGDKVDFVRSQLLYEGSEAVVSAAGKLSSGKFESSALPETGIFFDLDYQPRIFDAEELIQGDVCIDDSPGTLMRNRTTGKVEFGNIFFVSMMAVRQNQSPLLSPELRLNSYNRDELITYGGLLKTLQALRYKSCGIKGFQMTTQIYQGSKWVDRTMNVETWSNENNENITVKPNLPLNIW